MEIDTAFSNLVDGFDLEQTLEPAETGEPMSFWLPVLTKAKYERLQIATKGRFGKELKKSLDEAIGSTFEKSGLALEILPKQSRR